MANDKQSKEALAFSKYLQTKKILIADPSSSSRSGISKVFNDLGAKMTQMKLVNNYEGAVHEIETFKPHIVISEYELGKKCGLDLLQNQRSQNIASAKEILFILITGNTSQSAVARAAEEDIDAYVLKPFTVEVMRQILMKAALLKINPTDYVKAIEEGKNLLTDGKLDAAEARFNEAVGLDPQPALALYYVGQIKFMREILEQAKGNYSKGLEFNKIHYKCLVGLYELLMSQKEHSEAYEVVKRVSQYFPANPKRLAEVLRLAIVNKKYEDVEKYYAVFVNIDDRDETLIRYICAALVVCGKFYLMTKVKTRALELFQKASATGTGRTKVLREIIQALLEHSLVKEANGFLAKFPAESQKGEDYLLSQFQIASLSGDVNLTMNLGKELIAQNLANEALFTAMLEKCAENNLKNVAEAIYYQAIQKFPAQKEKFDKLFQASAEAS